MDATVRINEDYGETVPTNSQSTHETKNDGSGGNDNCASIEHGHVPHSMHPFHQVPDLLLSWHCFLVMLSFEFICWFCSATRYANGK